MEREIGDEVGSKSQKQKKDARVPKQDSPSDDYDPFWPPNWCLKPWLMMVGTLASERISSKTWVGVIFWCFQLNFNQCFGHWEMKKLFETHTRIPTYIYIYPTYWRSSQASFWDEHLIFSPQLQTKATRVSSKWPTKPNKLQLTKPTKLQLTKPTKLQLTKPNKLQLTNQTNQTSTNQTKQTSTSLSKPNKLQLTKPNKLQLTKPTKLQLTKPNKLQLTKPNKLQLTNQTKLQLTKPNKLQLTKPNKLQLH